MGGKRKNKGKAQAEAPVQAEAAKEEEPAPTKAVTEKVEDSKEAEDVPLTKNIE